MKKKLFLLLILVALSTHVFAQAGAKGIEGSWQGTLDAGEKLRLVLTVSKAADGTYTGKIDSLDQGAIVPIEVITVKGDSVRLEMKSVDAVFEGKMNSNSSELTGNFSQGGNTLPLTFKRSAEAKTEAPPAKPEAQAAKPEAQTAKPAAPQRPLDVPVEVSIPV